MSSSFRITVSKDYDRWPLGRYLKDGPYSGQRFRDELLLPALNNNDLVTVDMNNLLGYGSSFLDEAFAGLIRGDRSLPIDVVKRKLIVECNDNEILSEINEYIEEEAQRQGKSWKLLKL